MQQEGIDITFNVFSDTPEGKDPDSFNPTLQLVVSDRYN